MSKNVLKQSKVWCTVTVVKFGILLALESQILLKIKKYRFSTPKRSKFAKYGQKFARKKALGMALNDHLSMAKISAPTNLVDKLIFHYVDPPNAVLAASG